MDAATAVRLLRAATIATAVTAPLAWLDGTLFSWHPALMTVGALGAATEAALAARRARSLESGPDRAATLWAHARWAALALTCLALGMVAIVANKLRAGKHHLRSVHARVGAAGGVVGLAAAVLGSLAFRSLGLGRRLPVEWQARAKRWHRVAGPLAWSLCALSIELGLTHKAVYRPWLTRVWQAAVAGAAVLAGVLFYGPLQPVGVGDGLPVAMVEVEGEGG